MKKLLLTFVLVSIASFSSGGTVVGNGSTFVITETIALTTEQRTAFEAAAKVWADILVSSVDIAVNIEFSSSLSCTTNQATLGSAGPVSWAVTGITGIQDDVWYPAALINSKHGSDLFTAATYGANGADISAQFNADIGDADCLASQSWYYGLVNDGDSNTIDFYEVALHEIGHGLGVLSLILYDGTNGFFNSGLQDIYSQFLRDDNLNLDWTALTDVQRGTSITSNGDLVWNGTEVNALTGSLSAGVHADGHVRMYAPSSYESGSSVGHFDTALTPDELMEPVYTGGATHTLSTALLKDIGWEIYVPANATPVIDSQNSLSTDEETGLTLALANFNVTDSDNTYPTDFTLTVNSGSNYTVSGNTVTPAIDFVGTLTVPVTVNDGTSDSSSFNASVTVNNINDKPVISSQDSLSFNEDGSITLSTSDFTITDPDDSSFTLTVSSGSNYTFSGATVTPTANYFGTLTVPVVVNDGDVDSDSFDVSVTVISQNDSPVITVTPTLSFDEDTTLTLTDGDFTITDVESSSFTIDVADGSNYSVSGSTITPTANYNGSLSVNVRAYDGGAYSAVETLTITVDSVNDKPVITSQGSIQTEEDTDVTLVVSDFTISDPDDGAFTLTVSTGSNYSVSGNTITPAGGFSGNLTVPVVVNDGEIDSDSYNATVVVTLSGTVPVITGQSALTVVEDGSLTVSDTDLAITDSDSSSFTVIPSSGANYNLIGTQIFPDMNYFGVLTVPVVVNDGLSNSNSYGLTVTVTADNDAPVFTSTPKSQVLVDGNYSHQLIVSDVEGDSVTYNLDTAPTWLSVTAGGELIGSPILSDAGSHPITVSVSDGDLSDTMNFDIAVVEPNSADFVITLASGDVLISENNSIRMTATVSHVGPVASADATVEFTIDSTAQVQAMGAGCTLTNSNTVNCTVTALASNTDSDVTIDVVASSAATVNVFSTVTGVPSDVRLANNSADATLFFQDNAYIAPSDTVDSIGTFNSRSVAMGDVNGNGWDEIVFANATGQASEIYEFNGSYSSLVLFATLPDTLDSNDVVFVDVDKANGLDLVFANGSTGGNVIYLNDGNGTYTESEQLGSGNSNAVTVGDFNGDGWSDLAFANGDGEANVVYLNDQTGAFVAIEQLGDSDSRDIALIDFNDDGWDDLVVANNAGDNLIYVNNGADQSTGLFDSNAVLLGTQIQNSHSVIVADLETDGSINNIVIGDETTDGNASVTIYEVSSSQQISIVSQFDSGDVIGLSAGNIDEDDLLDLAVVNSVGVMQHMLQNSSGDFVRDDIVENSNSRLALLVQINDDTLADTVLALESSVGNSLLLNHRILNEEPDVIVVVVETTVVNNTDNSETTVVVVKSSGSLGGLMMMAFMLLIVGRRKSF